MANGVSVGANGSGFLGILLILFIALKLIGIPPAACWSWWWVMAPFWAPIALIVAIMLVVLFVACCVKALK